jgi:hypothetical protein
LGKVGDWGIAEVHVYAVCPRIGDASVVMIVQIGVRHNNRIQRTYLTQCGRPAAEPNHKVRQSNEE